LSDVLKAVPQVNVVLVRTRGLWGSRFSYAFTGSSPGLGKRLLQGAGLLLANLLFLAPRRPVDITLEHIPPDRLPSLERDQLNPRRAPGHTRAGPGAPPPAPAPPPPAPPPPDSPPLTGAAEADLSQLRPETRAAVDDLLEAKLRRPLTPAERQPETPLD